MALATATLQSVDANAATAPPPAASGAQPAMSVDQRLFEQALSDPTREIEICSDGRDALAAFSPEAATSDQHLKICFVR